MCTIQQWALAALQTKVGLPCEVSIRDKPNIRATILPCGCVVEKLGYKKLRIYPCPSLFRDHYVGPNQPTYINLIYEGPCHSTLKGKSLHILGVVN